MILKFSFLKNLDKNKDNLIITDNGELFAHAKLDERLITKIFGDAKEFTASCHFDKNGNIIVDHKER